MGITTSGGLQMLDRVAQEDKTCEYVCQLPCSSQDPTEGGSSSLQYNHVSAWSHQLSFTLQKLLIGINRNFDEEGF